MKRLAMGSATWMLQTVLAIGVSSVAVVGTAASAQAASAAGTRQLGTVKSIDAGKLTVATDDGKTVVMSLASAARVQQLAPGQTDLKMAEPSSAADIVVGDRVLAVGKMDGDAFVAARVVLMKTTAIAERNQASQADWQRRGSGGIVTTVDPAANSIGISSGTRKVLLTTKPATIVRRYAPGSIKFEDAKRSTLAEIQPGDQLRVRGEKSADGTSVAAEEIVSGSFRNLSGTVISVDATANTVTLKDLVTKKNQTVSISTGSDLRTLPPEMAARFVQKPRPAGAAAGTAPPAGAPAAGAGAGGYAGRAPGGERPAGMGGNPGGPGGPGGQAGRGAGGGAPDLSQMITRLPKTTLADLKPGAALMIVASGSATAAGPLTAITLLSGVEPILAATPVGEAPATISPWSLGSNGAEAAGGAGGAQ